MSAAIAAAYSVAPPEEREKALVSYGSDLQAEVRALIDEAHSLRVTAVRKRDIRTALKGIDTALKALEMFAKLSGQLQGPQHNHLHLHAEVPSREEAIEAARECLEVFAPQLLAAMAMTIDTPELPEEEPASAQAVICPRRSASDGGRVRQGEAHSGDSQATDRPPCLFDGRPPGP